MSVLRGLPVAALLALAGCAAAPVAPVPIPFDTATAVAAVRAAGRAGPTEVDIRPLADPQVTDLRAQAAEHEAAGRVAAAADALDQALSLTPGDPVLLQERGELSLLQGHWSRALELALRSHAAGPGIGPLCRRQHELQAQVALAQATQGNADARPRADAARRARDACTVVPPPRY